MSSWMPYPVRGSIEVELECGHCGKKEWVHASLENGEDQPSYAAIRFAQDLDDWWQWLDDWIVCSDACQAAYWDGQWA